MISESHQDSAIPKSQPLGMPRAIALYLPQFHPTPENNEWWGRGFTEWTNVVKARPLFPGHYQPHLPADLGFCDLRLPEVRESQANLARQHGLSGFCYYHYWFNGRRILERPFDEVLASGKPDFPFCLCWANENWTRVWDGGDRHVLLEQKYSAEDDLKHIESLLPAFKDPRYIKIDRRPLFLVYRTELLPDPKASADRWRAAALAAGLPGLFLARVEHFVSDVHPESIGFDAAVEFAPDGARGEIRYRGPLGRALATLGLIPQVFSKSNVISYGATVQEFMNKPEPAFKRFLCVTPMWDNSARRSVNANIFVGSTPDLYKRWLVSTIEKTMRRHRGDERLVFINAWNEWGEGCHLEPDQRWGGAYLAATSEALATASSNGNPGDAERPGSGTGSSATPFSARRLWWRGLDLLRRAQELLRLIRWHLLHNE